MISLRKLVEWIAMETVATACACAQVTPTPYAAYLGTGTPVVWQPWTSAAAFGAISFTPTAIGLYCQASAGAAWTPCNPSGGGGSGFPITLGATSIAGSSTTTAVTGLSVNGVTLTNAGSPTAYLNGSGGYTTPSGGSTVDTRPMRTTSVEYITINPGASYTFSTSPTSPSTAGTITHIHITMSQVAGDLVVAPQYSTVTSVCDGDTETVPIGLFFANMDTPTAFASDWIASALGSAVNNSFNHRTEINYSSGCTLTFNNLSYVATLTFFADVQYRVGANVSRSTRQHWHAYAVPQTPVAQYATLASLPTTGAADGGELESYTLWVNNQANSGYVEGDPTATADGSVAVTANGTEDFFGCGYECGNGVGGMRISKWGFMYATNVSSGQSLQNPVSVNDTLGYRLFDTIDSDNVIFTSSLATAWPNGNSGEGTAPGVSNAATLTTWWTHDAMAAPVTYSPAGGQISLPATVTLASATSGATICYTTDGSAPIGNGAGGCTHGTSGTSVTVSSAEVVSAIATKSGSADSEITSATYGTSASLAFVTGNTQSNGGTSSNTITSASISPSVGDHIVAFCRGGTTATAGIFNVTSSNAADKIVNMGQINNLLSGGDVMFYVDQAAPGGARTYTCTTTTAQSFLGMAVLDYSAGTTHFFGGLGAPLATATTTPTTGTFSTTAAGLIVACFDPQYGVSAITAGTIGGAGSTAREASANFQCQDVITGSAQSNITANASASTSGKWGYGVIDFQ